MEGKKQGGDQGCDSTRIPPLPCPTAVVSDIPRTFCKINSDAYLGGRRGAGEAKSDDAQVNQIIPFTDEYATYPQRETAFYGHSNARESCTVSGPEEAEIDAPESHLRR